jgi:hypothetical protein
VKPLDALKLGLLLVAILIWFVGFRLNNQPVMLGAMFLVVIAFALRFIKAPPAPPAR